MAEATAPDPDLISALNDIPGDSSNAPAPSPVASSPPSDNGPDPDLIAAMNDVQKTQAPASPTPAANQAPSRPQRWATPAPVRSAPSSGAPAQRAPISAKAPPPPSTFSGAGLSDITKTALAQGALGVGDLVGLPGTIQQLWNKGSDWATSLGIKAAGALGINGQTPQSAAAAIAHAKQLAQAQMTPAERQGTVAKVFGIDLPTTSGTEQWMRKQVPQLGYTPKTTAAKVIGAGARALPMALIPGVGEEGLLAKGATMAASGMASEGAGEAAQTYAPSLEPYARLAGAFAGPAALGSVTQAVSRLAGNSPKLGSALADALSKDAASGQLQMTPEQIAQAQTNGTQVGLWNVGGPRTRALVAKMGATSPEAEQAIGTINQRIAAQSAASNAALSSHISNTLGLGQGAFDLQQSIREGNQADIGNLYKNLETDPAATAIDTPGLQTLAQSDTIAQMGKKAASIATDPGSRIIPPSDETPGNLFYWDQVKRNLDGGIGVAMRTGDNPEAARLMGLKKQLLTELDTAVPAYADARGAASDSFGAQNAVEAGYNAFKKNVNNFSAGQIANAFQTYNPAQQQLFAQGAGSYLKELAEKEGSAGGPQAVVKQFNDPNKAALLSTTLGPNNANSILGKAQSETVMQNARAYSVGSQRAPGITDQALNAGILYEGLPSLGAAFMGHPGPLMKIIGAKTLEGVINSLGSSKAKSAATSVLNSLGSDDPSTLSQLPEMMKNIPQSQGFMQNLLGAMRDAAIKTEIANPTSQDQTNPAQPPPPAAPAPGLPAGPGAPPLPAASPKDVDAATRMIIGEAGNQPDSGKAAVLYTAINRARMSGKPLASVINAPNAYEAVTSGKTANIDPNSSEYQKIRDIIVIPALNGQIDDPTGGMTHFINKNLQTQLGRKIPSWAEGPGLPIGAHTFYSANGGRIQLASGGAALSHEQLVDRLMKRAEQAKKAADASTKPLLNVPDNTVVKALDLAQRSI